MVMDILSEEQANGISEVLTKAFKGRLLEVIDQAQHFAALGPAGGGGPSTDTAQSFREGRPVVFALAQESAKRMKRWHEGNDKARR
jgi:GINS complex subunit 3